MGASGRSDSAPAVRLLVVACGAEKLVAELADSHEGDVGFASAERPEDAAALLGEGACDAVLVDLSVDEEGGFAALERLHAVASRIPVLALAERDDDAAALRALRLGAQDYLLRDETTPRSLIRSLRHAAERHRMMSSQERTREREHFLATRDGLTNLPNRFAFNEQLDRSLAYAARHLTRLAVFFLDIDRFKYINDTLGHSVGDELLVQVAERLAAETRRSDMVARIGGDEFIAMVQDLDDDRSAARVSEKLLESLSMPCSLDGRDYWITASLGISVFPRDGQDRETLVRNADVAMYQAKAQGKNNYRFYSPALNAESRRRLNLEQSLRRAFERGELRIYYQPLVEVGTRKVIGAEALLRWHDKELGHVSTQEFVALAEETGLIRPIGDWVLRSACAQAKQWQDEGFTDCRLSVNVSTQQIGRQSLREEIVRALWETGLDPASLTLEITESTLMKSSETCVPALQELKRMGVGVALDDFGTGFSSLSYLKLIPVDTIKIDHSFVQDLARDPDDEAIVAAVLSLADELGLQVVAEGVETEEQLAFLTERGCRMMQGYLFSKALPPERLLELLRAQASETPADPEPTD